MAKEEEKGQGEEEEVNALSGRGQSGRRGRRPEVESRGKFRPWKLSRDRAKEKESAEEAAGKRRQRKARKTSAGFVNQRDSKATRIA